MTQLSELSELIASFAHKRRRPKDIGSFLRVRPKDKTRHGRKHRRRRYKHRLHKPPRVTHDKTHRQRPETLILGDIHGLHVEIHPLEGVIFKNGRSRLFQVRNDATTTEGEGTSGSDSVTDAELTAHTADADAHHTWPLTEPDIPSSIARDTELTSAVSTHAADNDAHHPPVTMGAETAPIFDIGAGQTLTLDNQNANEFFGGPSSGAADTPGFRTLVDADIPSTIARDSELTSAISTHTADNDAHHTYPVPTAGIADNAVDDTKVGNRVPQFYRRQGGSATDWHTPGTTTRTPEAVRTQKGYVSITGATDDDSVTITFPQAFSARPTVLAQAQQYDPTGADGAGTEGVWIAIPIHETIEANEFEVIVKELWTRDPANGAPDLYIYWEATGPE